MTTQIAVGAPVLPRVNLLPPEIAEARRFRQIQVGLGAAVAVAVLAVGGLWYHAHAGVANAQNALDTANAQNTQLQAQLARYSSVTTYKNQVQGEEAQLQTAVGSEVLWSHYLTDLSLNMPGNVWFTELRIGAGVAGATPSATPAASGAIGQLQLQGNALTHDDVASLLEALGQEKGFANPYFSKSAETTVANTTKTTAQFIVSADITRDALCGAPCLDPQAGG